MKKITFFMISIAMIFSFTISVLCEISNTIIKVGLISEFQNISLVNISNSSLLLGFQKEDNFKYSGIISGNNFSVRKCSEFYYSSEDTFKSYDEAKKVSGDNGIPVLVDIDCWKIYFTNYSQNKSKVQCGKNSVALFDGNNIAVIFDSPIYLAQIKDSQNRNITINGKDFRGGIEFLINNSSFTLINVLYLDEYLYGVIPAEMSSDSPKEALKAQAVASRCFALYSSKNSRHSKNYYDLCDSTHCQVYKGVYAEEYQTNAAVDETKNIAAYYNNEIIEAPYFSSSGGSTADSFDVWNIEIPYLKPVYDSYEFDPDIWTRVFSFDEMTDIVNNNGENIGNVNNVFIGSEDKFGRVNALIIEGTNGNLTLEGERIRNFFSKSKDGSLLSRNFSMSNDFSNTISQNSNIYVLKNNQSDLLDFINIKTIDSKESIFDFLGEKINVIGYTKTKIYDKNKKINSTIHTTQNGDIVFYGKGSGHGVGMSQKGAIALAENGFDYIQILNYYYSKIDVNEFDFKERFF